MLQTLGNSLHLLAPQHSPYRLRATWGLERFASSLDRGVLSLKCSVAWLSHTRRTFLTPLWSKSGAQTTKPRPWLHKPCSIFHPPRCCTCSLREAELEEHPRFTFTFCLWNLCSAYVFKACCGLCGRTGLISRNFSDHLRWQVCSPESICGSEGKEVHVLFSWQP